MGCKKKTAYPLALSMILSIVLTGCGSAPISTPSAALATPPPPGFTATASQGAGIGAASPSPAPIQSKKVVSFSAEADLDGDGVLEKVEEGRYPMEGNQHGDTFLTVAKGAELYSYAFDKDEPGSFPEHVELADVDGDTAAEILIWRDLGSGYGPGQVLNFQENSFACIFDTRTAKPDIQVSYAANYTLLVQSKTMKPTRMKYPLQPGEKFAGVYDEKGKLLNRDYKCLVDPPSGMRSVRTKENGPADIAVEQFCTGAGGHSADGLGIIRTTYRYYPQGWEIVSTTFEFTGQ